MASTDVTKPETPTLDRMQAPHHGAWTRREGEPCRLVDHSQLIGEFLDWLEANDIVLARWGQHDEVPVYWDRESAAEAGVKFRGFLSTDELGEGEVNEFVVKEWKPIVRENQMEPHHEHREKLLARYFEIDLDKADDEKRALLDYVRKVQDAAHT